MNEIDKIIEEVTAEHPYKERDNRDSYSQYNEGWSDACDILGERIKQALSLYSVSNRFSDPKFIDNVCLSYRHDFGLLSEDEKNKVRFECKEWMRAIKNNEPY